MSNQPIGGYKKIEDIRCAACLISDCEVCTREEKCKCYCWHDYQGNPVPNAKPGWQVPSAGTEGRKYWLGRHQPFLPSDGYVHLHVQLHKGQPRWIISPRGSSVCRIPGRCLKVHIHD